MSAVPVDYRKLHFTERKKIREEYVRLQNGLCIYCKEPLNGPERKDIQEKTVRKELFPKDFFKWPIHLHHDHRSGMTIGAVHCKCNAVLWQYHRE